MFAFADACFNGAMDTKVTDRVDNARSKTGHAMARASKTLRRGSRKAADVIKRGGERGADALEASSSFVTPSRRQMRGRGLMLVVMSFAVIVVVAILFARGRSDSFDD